jgi:hypothetical protein
MAAVSRQAPQGLGCGSEFAKVGTRSPARSCFGMALPRPEITRAMTVPKSAARVSGTPRSIVQRQRSAAKRIATPKLSTAP